jgi:transposase
MTWRITRSPIYVREHVDLLLMPKIARDFWQVAATKHSAPCQVASWPGVDFERGAELPELGSLNHKQIAALVGVAPRARDSGKFRGKRMIWGGRAPVRSALYLSVWSASKWNPVIRPFYQRLRDQAKPARVAQTACMRKLLTILNAMVRDGRSWDPSIPLGQLKLQHSC